MPTDYKTTDTELTSIANAIRTKGGTSAQLTFPSGFISAIEAITSGGGASNYTITVSLTNPISPSDFSYCNIYEAENPDFEESMLTTSLATLSSPTGSATVSIPSTSYGIIIYPIGNWGATYTNNAVSCTGKISFIENSMFFVGASLYLVGGDGTVTINGIDYGD